MDGVGYAIDRSPNKGGLVKFSVLASVSLQRLNKMNLSSRQNDELSSGVAAAQKDRIMVGSVTILNTIDNCKGVLCAPFYSKVSNSTLLMLDWVVVN